MGVTAEYPATMICTCTVVVAFFGERQGFSFNTVWLEFADSPSITQSTKRYNVTERHDVYLECISNNNNNLYLKRVTPITIKVFSLVAL